MLQIRPVHSRAALSAFIKTPRLIYSGMPHYVAPLDFERRQMLDPKKAKFFEHGEAQYWVAYDGEKPVGRISAQIDRLALETWGERIGCFGCLDAIDDASVVKALCDTAAEWLTARGMVRMRGPFTLSINGESGVQIEGQEDGGMILMPWHPKYLAGHVAAAGLDAVKDMLAYTVRFKDYKRREELLAMAHGRLPASLTIRSLDMRQLDRDAEMIRTVFNEAWRNNWSFVPITESEIQNFAHSFKPFIIAECGQIAELDGKPVGMAVLLPNLFEPTADFGGKLFPFNWIKFLLRAFRISSYRSVRILLFGIVPQLHGMAAALAFAMIDDLLTKAGRYAHFEAAEMSWVLEDNRPVTAMMSAFGVPEPNKRYRMFEKALG